MIVYTKPSEQQWCWSIHAGHVITTVHAPQLRMDFADKDGPIGHAVILVMQEYAFILYVDVAKARRGHGFGLAIHAEIARRYGGVACETHCSSDEMRVWEAMARRRGEWRISLKKAPTCMGRPAIVRSGAGVGEMLVARLAVAS